MEDKSNSENVTASETPASNTTPVKKVAKSKSKTQRSKASHPPTSEMVNAAIKELKDRKGSSLQAIKKYIATTYEVDGEKFAPFIKKYLKAAVTSGTVVQTKGKGASGSFKLSSTKSGKSKGKVQRAAKPVEAEETKSVEKKTMVTRKPPAPKKASPSKKSSAAEKKSVAQKKPPAKSPTAEKVKIAKPKATQAKAISKTKKTAKAPAAKTKTPKPKKTAASKSVKATAKK